MPSFDYCPPIVSYRQSSLAGWFDVTIDGEQVESVDREEYAKELCDRIKRLGYKAYRAYGLI